MYTFSFRLATALLFCTSTALSVHAQTGLTSSRTLSWVDGAWVEQTRSSVERPVSNRAAIEITTIEEQVDGEWKPTRRTRHEVNSDSVRITEERFEDAGWVDVSRITQHLAESGQWVRVVVEAAQANDDWIPLTQTTYMYDDEQRATSIETSSWTGERWENTRRLEYQYIPNQTIRETQLWQDGTWESRERVYTFAEETISEVFELGVWVPTTRTLLEGNTETRFTWSNDAWEPTFRTERTREGGRVTAIVNERYDGSQWQPSFRTRRTFEEDNLVEVFTDTWEDDTWKPSSWTINTYIASVAVEVPQSPTLFQVYPNPLQGSRLTIRVDHQAASYQTVELYNVLGQRVQQIALTSRETTVEVSLRPGVYFARLGSQTRTLIRPNSR